MSSPSGSCSSRNSSGTPAYRSCTQNNISRTLSAFPLITETPHPAGLPRFHRPCPSPARVVRLPPVTPPLPGNSTYNDWLCGDRKRNSKCVEFTPASRLLNNVPHPAPNTPITHPRPAYSPYRRGILFFFFTPIPSPGKLDTVPALPFYFQEEQVKTSINLSHIPFLTGCGQKLSAIPTLRWNHSPQKTRHPPAAPLSSLCKNSQSSLIIRFERPRLLLFQRTFTF